MSLLVRASRRIDRLPRQLPLLPKMDIIRPHQTTKTTTTTSTRTILPCIRRPTRARPMHPRTERRARRMDLDLLRTQMRPLWALILLLLPVFPIALPMRTRMILIEDVRLTRSPRRASLRLTPPGLQVLILVTCNLIPLWTLPLLDLSHRVASMSTTMPLLDRKLERTRSMNLDSLKPLLQRI